MEQQFKADHDKIRPSLLMEGMPRALMAISSVLTYGAKKYEAHSWKKVDINRYKDALFRHMLEAESGLGDVDAESGLLHLAHQACNVLFILEDRLSSMSDEEFKSSLNFNNPPTDHKEGR